MLELQNISLGFEGEKEIEILKGIDLKLDNKKIYAITGPNGGGKSSLAKTIMGIYSPTTGRILLDDEDITDLEITARARKGIAYAFQNPPRFKGIKVKELLNIASGNKEDNSNIYDLLYDVGLCPQDYLDREVDGSLSGGEMKRIEIATILARNAKVAVFDEPEAGIDLWSFQKLAETFRKINEKYDTTIIIISHQERILELADEIILLSNGQISEVFDRTMSLQAILNREDCFCTTKC